MNKVVLKTALIMLAALAAAALIVFSLWLLCSPQTMASSCEKTGNYSFAVTCADLRYKYTKNVSDLARCAEDGILSGKDEHITQYCGKLTAHEQFEKLCEEKNAQFADGKHGAYTVNYKAYICSHLAAAEYRGGDLAAALQTAETGGEESYSRLIAEIVKRADKPAAQGVIAQLEGYNTESVKSLIEVLNKIA